ncbi:MAG: deoxyribodipyrimidine photolyase [Leptospiraceae bacterium]|nr:deoxyribodipyrimidine photolyase [Leptospiraceae bacterium]
MQAFRRLEYNHALFYAASLSKEYGKPLVILEALRSDYPYNSSRLHRFILEGICDNKQEAKKLGLEYHAFVETGKNPGRGLMKRLSSEAFAIVTDDFPAFIIPSHNRAIAEKAACPVFAVDSNSMIPLELYGKLSTTARSLRIKLHDLFSEALSQAVYKRLKKTDFIRSGENCLRDLREFSARKEDIPEVLSQIQFQYSVLPVPQVIGGRQEALKILKNFLKYRLIDYSSLRSPPLPPERQAVSGLSAYLHFGHISSEEIVRAVLSYYKENWSPAELIPENRGKNSGFFSNSESVDGFLDELLTWRDISYQLFWKNPGLKKDFSVLPDWAKQNLEKHKNDKREFIYSLKQFESAKTHDPIWNAAQLELVNTGKMQNYLRMLWGKKLIEWSSSFEEALNIMEYLNNLYAYDGRNPNSYGGILWCFGLFDRPWFPERNVLGNIRYMSSDSTKRKFKLKEYLEYIETLTKKQESLF